MRETRSVAVIGGGPGGLYFASLLKRDRPDWQIEVVERNPAHETFGFGVAFQETTLANLAAADRVSQAGLVALLQPWDVFTFHARGTQVGVSDLRFGGCSRHDLLGLLQRRATDLGVSISFETTASPADFPTADLIVAADGSASRTRSSMSDRFGVVTEERANRFIWLGTTLPMETFNFFFKERPEGLVVAHAYPHAHGVGTFIVEVSETTFQRLQLDPYDTARTTALVVETFADELRGHDVITSGSFWRKFPLVTCSRWVDGNVVLLGDAKGTVHFSIGSGTKIAMEDAATLHQSIVDADDDIPTALTHYEKLRRPAFDQLRSMAHGSMLWFEQMDSNWRLDPKQFIFAAATRKTTETYATLRQQLPDFVDAAVAVIGGDESTGPPLTLPLAIGDLSLGGRGVGPLNGWKNPETPPSLLLADISAVDPDDAVTAALDRAADVPLGVVLRHPALSAALGARRAPSTAELDAVTTDLTRVADVVLKGGAQLITLDLSCGDSDLAGVTLDAVEQVLGAVRHNWPSGLPVGVRISARRLPTDAAKDLARLPAGEYDFVDVAGPRAGLLAPEIWTAEAVRNGLGIIAVCSAPLTADEADTIIAAGRADLTMLAPD